MGQDPRIDQVVVEHDIGARQALDAAQRQQAGIAGSAADDVDFAGAGLGHADLPGAKGRRMVIEKNIVS